MTKRILKIILTVIAVTGMILFAIYGITSVSAEKIFDEVLSHGLGISGQLLKQTIPYQPSEINTRPLPFTYINLPTSQDMPLAMGIYDKIYQDWLSQNPALPEDSTNDNPPTITPPAEEGYPIISLDMSDMQSVGNLTYKNESNYSPDINKLASSEYPIKLSKNTSTGNITEPLVLIIHTHGTECYMEEGKTTYTEDTPTRNHDIQNNVVAVGKVMADTLNSLGVPTIHCESMFDIESYSAAYSNSEKAIEEYLKKYPSIQYIFDVHRDSLTRANNERIKTVTQINGEDVAQVMFVVGTDSLGAKHPDWVKNLTVASIFQNTLVEKYSTLMRPINLRAASFNAEHAPGSILIEMGTCANTLSEAKKSASHLAETIAEIILTDGLV